LRENTAQLLKEFYLKLNTAQLEDNKNQVSIGIQLLIEQLEDTLMHIKEVDFHEKSIINDLFSILNDYKALMEVLDKDMDDKIHIEVVCEDQDVRHSLMSALINRILPDSTISEGFKTFQSEDMNRNPLTFESLDIVTENELLSRFTLTYNQGGLTYDYPLANCILLYVDAEKLYFHKTDDLIESLMGKKVIAVVDESKVDQHRDVLGDVDLEEEVKKAYKNQIDAVCLVSIKDAFEAVKINDNTMMFKSGLVQLNKILLEYCYTDKNMVKVHSITMNCNQIIKRLQYDLNDTSIKLQSGENKQTLHRKDLRESIQKLSEMTKVKIDWLFDGYELTLKNNLDNKCKDVIEMSGQLHNAQIFVEEQIIASKSFLEELKKLEVVVLDTLIKYVEQNASKYRVVDIQSDGEKEKSIYFQDFNITERELMSSVDLNLILNTIFGKSGFILPFARKKKIISLQEELNKVLSVSIKLLKAKATEMLKSNIENINEFYSRSLEESFKDQYCDPKFIAHFVRLLKNLETSIEWDVERKSIIQLIKN